MKEEVTGEHFNSIIAVNKNLDIIYQYNKRKLVPFGEFLPLEFFTNKVRLKKNNPRLRSFFERYRAKKFKYKSV